MVYVIYLFSSTIILAVAAAVAAWCVSASQTICPDNSLQKEVTSQRAMRVFYANTSHGNKWSCAAISSDKRCHGSELESHVIY